MRSKCRCVCSIFGYRLHDRRPACKLIRVLRCSSLLRCRTCRRRTIFPLLGFQFRAILVLERDGIFVHGLRELRRISCIIRNRHDGLIPPLECVRVLSITFLNGRCAGICRGITVSHLISLQRLAVTVFPRDLIFIHRACERCLVCRITRHLSQSWSPLIKRISVLCRSSLSRRSRIGHCTVRQSLMTDLSARVVQIRNGVGAHCAAELCRIGCITGHCRYSGRPCIIERVRVLRGSRLGRRCSCVFRSITINNLLSLQRIAISVHPCDGVQIIFRRERCFVRSITCYANHFRSPTGKRVCILVCSCFRRLCACRRCAIRPLFRLDCCTIFILERDGVLIRSLRIGCSISSVCRCGYKCLIPALECVSILCIALLGRRCAAIYWHFSLFHLIRLKLCAILINKADHEVMRVACVEMKVIFV